MFRYRVNVLLVRGHSATVGNVSYIGYRFYDRLESTVILFLLLGAEELFAIPDVRLITGEDKNFHAFISRVIRKDYYHLDEIRIRKRFMDPRVFK